MERQKLRTLIIQHLLEKPRSGYALIQSIEEATGWKPSYGSIYPQLEQLHEEKLVTFKEEGKKKTYTLTKKGKDEAKLKKEKLLDNLQENMRVLTHMLGIGGKEHDQMMEFLVGAMKRGDRPFKEVEDASNRMQMTFWKLYEEKKVKKNANKINNILDEATKQLEEL